jgi:glucose-1-phosphate adenylyltransferase
MEGSVIGKNSYVERAVIDEFTTIGEEVYIGYGENIPNENHPNIYNTGISVVGQNSVIPDGVRIGKNCVIFGETKPEDYKDNELASGKSLEITEELA